MEIYGKEYTVKELRKRVGNMDQIAGIRTVELDDGNERPTRCRDNQDRGWLRS